LGFWTLITSTVPKASLDGMVIPHAWPMWTDNTSYVANMSAMLEKYRPSEVSVLKQGTTWESGWLLAHIITDVVRRAAKKVGPENIDNIAIRDAIEEMDIDIEGMPAFGLAGSGGNNVLQPYFRMIKYNASEDKWYALGDWFYALGQG